MKLLVKLAIVVVVLVAAALVAALVYVDVVAARAIELGGQRAFGVRTDVDRADVKVFAGAFELSGLRVANPAGFDSPHFMRVGRGRTVVDLATLRAPRIELPELVLGEIDVNLQRAGGTANYQAILDHLRRYETGPRSDTAGKRYVIRTLRIEDVTVHVDLLPEAGEAARVDVAVPPIELTDVGADGDRGVLMGELMDVLIKSILAAVTELGVLPQEVLADLRGRLGELTGIGGDVLGEVRSQVEQLENAAGELGEQLQNLGEQAGGLLKGLRRSSGSSGGDGGS